MSKLLTEDAVARYRRDGVHWPVPVLTADEVAYYRGCLEGFERNQGGPLRGPMMFKTHLLFTWVHPQSPACGPPPRGPAPVAPAAAAPPPACRRGSAGPSHPSRPPQVGWTQPESLRPASPQLTSKSGNPRTGITCRTDATV